MNPVEEDRALDGESDLAPRDERRGRAAMDPTTRHLALIASGIGLLLAILIGGWMLSGQHSGSIPVIEAASGPVRLKPIDPGGMQAMGAQAPSTSSAKGVETLAPSPEDARPDSLQAEVEAARRADAAAPAVARPDLPGPAVAVPSAPVAQAPPSDIPPAGAPLHGSPLRTEATPDSAVASGAGDRLAVQLAALSSHDAAQTEWARLRHSHPTLLSGRTPEVDQADRDGRTIYRLRTGGFASVAEATAFCKQARAQRVACTLADF